MSWYNSNSKSSKNIDANDVEDGVGTNRADVRCARDKRESSAEITVESDADETVGRYSRDKPISFQKSREKAKTSQEARESRGEELTESPLSDITENENSVEEERADAQDVVSKECDVENSIDAQEFGNALRDQLQKRETEETTTIATGKTHSREYEFVETTVHNDSVFAIIETRTSGVTFQKILGNYGKVLSTPSIAIDTDVITTAITGKRKHQKHQTRYQRDANLVSELTTDQISELAYYYQKITTELLSEVVTWSEYERQERGVSVSVVENCIVATGKFVTARLEDELQMWMSDKQIDAVIDTLPDAVENSEELISDTVRSEISRASTLSGECVVAGRLILDC